jgi:DNA-binding IclR family transcriptional regulator
VPVSEPDVPRAVGRAFELLELVVASGEVNLTIAAQQAELTPTTALRHLRALEALGYVDRDRDGVYSAGPAVFRLAAAARGDGPLARLVAAAQPVLDELTETTGESSYLAVAEADRALYVATSESARSIRHVGWVGRPVPLDGTAVGAALLGAPGPQHRTGTIEPDISAVAHAVIDGDRVVAALSVIGPAHRMDAAAVATSGEALTRAATRLSTALGLAAPPSRQEAAR